MEHVDAEKIRANIFPTKSLTQLQQHANEECESEWKINHKFLLFFH